MTLEIYKFDYLLIFLYYSIQWQKNKLGILASAKYNEFSNINRLIELKDRAVSKWPK